INEGDSFNEGDILLEVATDKVDNEVPAPVSGTLVKILFQAKDVVPVGEVMAILEVSEEGSKVQSTDNKTSIETDKSLKQIEKPLTSIPPNSYQDTAPRFAKSGGDFFSPLIISIAKEQHIS